MSIDKATGKRSVAFSFAEALVPNAEPIPLPCGKCLGCQKERTIAWGIRAMHESKSWDANSFLTLSYDKKHLPRDKMLRKSDFQKFMKRLRKATGLKMKYIHCGEYGSKTFRAHYHALLFGYDFPDKRVHKTGKNGDPLYISEELHGLWGNGLCMIGAVSFASAQYVAKYINKGSGQIPFSDHASYVAPYNTVSRGIGFEWLQANWKDIYPMDRVIMDGGKYKPPRAYDKWLEANEPEIYRQVKRERAKKAYDNKLDISEQDMRGIANEAKIEFWRGSRDAI